ncbi:hypothetical protein QQ045_024950 [Rhodiola kirilowii]
MASAIALFTASAFSSPKQTSLRRESGQQAQKLSYRPSGSRFTVRAASKEIAFDQKSRAALIDAHRSKMESDRQGIEKIGERINLARV